MRLAGAVVTLKEKPNRVERLPVVLLSFMSLFTLELTLHEALCEASADGDVFAFLVAFGEIGVERRELIVERERRRERLAKLLGSSVVLGLQAVDELGMLELEGSALRAVRSLPGSIRQAIGLIDHVTVNGASKRFGFRCRDGLRKFRNLLHVQSPYLRSSCRFSRRTNLV